MTQRAQNGDTELATRIAAHTLARLRNLIVSVVGLQRLKEDKQGLSQFLNDSLSTTAHLFLQSHIYLDTGIESDLSFSVQMDSQYNDDFICVVKD